MVNDGFKLRDEYFDPIRCPPLIVMEWNDDESNAVGYLAINSLRGGAAGGGTRLRFYRRAIDARAAAIELAKTMELKFLITGPPIGGAKAVINVDLIASSSEEAGKKRRAILGRWLAVIRPWLELCYGTGGDENTSDQELIDLVRQLGLHDPRQGVVVGAFGTAIGTRLENVREGILLPVPDITIGGAPCKIGDLITGYGVAYSVKFCCQRLKEPISGKRIVIEGFGNVGAATAYFLDKWGAHVIRVMTLAAVDDRHGYRIAYADRDKLDVAFLIGRRVGTNLSWGSVPCQADELFRDVAADVFIPAGTSGTITDDRLHELVKAGVHIVAPGANNPFASAETERSADAELTMIPDFIANCGMARAYSFLMTKTEPVAQEEWEKVIEAVENTISGALEDVWRVGESHRNLLSRSYARYVSKVMSGAQFERVSLDVR